MNAYALPVLVLLLWITVVSGLSTSSFAQQAEPKGNILADRGPETSAAAGKKAFLAPQEMHWLSQHDGLIRIGITVIPPQVLRIDGQYRGLAIDYIHLMERRLGCRFKLAAFGTWNEVIKAAKSRRIDMIFAAQQTPKRLAYLLFTEPYIEKAGILNLRVAGNAGLLYQLRFAVRSDWPVLRGILDKGLAASTDEERRAITRRWIIVGQKGILADETFWIPLATGLTVIILVVVGVILWNRTLSRVVRQRTSQLQQELAERRLAQEALRESEKKYRCIVDTASEGILVLGPDTLTTFVNARMTEMLGYSAAEMIGRPLTDFIFAEDLPDHRMKMEARRKGESDNYERRLRRKDEGTVWTQISATPVFDEAYRFQGSFGMFADITSRKQAEEALLRLNRQLRAISTCNQVLMQASDEQTLLNQICRIVCEEAGYRMAWVGYIEKDTTKTVRPVAWAGFEEGYLAEAGITWADTERGRGPAGRAIREGTSAFIQDFATDPQAVPWRQSALQRGYRSSTALPLKDENGMPFGTLCIYSAEPGTFTLEEMKLLEELAANLAFGICVLRTRAARKQADQDVALMSFALNNVGEAAFLIDEHACFTYVNEEACRVLGYTRDELLARGVADVDPEFPTQRWPDHWRELAAKRAITFESRHKTKDSRILPVEINANYIEYGQKSYNLALVRNITERKQMERELILREREYRTLLESVPDLIVRYNLDIQRIYVNPAWEKASGLSATQVTGVPPADIPRVPKPIVEEYLKKLHKAKETGASQTAEFSWINAYGEKLFLEYVIVPEFDDQGKIAGVLAVGRDITDRKQAEEKLIASEERLRMTLEATQMGIWDWDVVHDRFYASSIYYSMLGYEPKQGSTDGSEWMQHLHPDDKNKVLEEVRNVLSGTSGAYSYEARFRHADGSYRWQWVFGYGAENDKEGKATRMLGLRMDIDQRKQMERELSAYREHLEELVRERTAELEKSQEQIISLNQDLRTRATALEAANKELDAFAYTVSHDLRAPLRHIDGFIELLQKRATAALDEQSRLYMDTICEAAKKMGRLIDDLLSFSRMGRQALSLHQVEMAPLVREVIRELETEATGRKIEWRIGDLPSVNGDERMLRIVLTNLISNALKFTRTRPQAWIEIGSLPDQDSESVLFIRDNGVGFDMAYAGKLFGVFQRLHRAEDFEGTGIGLASVRSIIARHGGRTWAQGEPDRGAAFYFTLPRTLQARGDGKTDS